jgi:hypothetical protein
MHTVSIAGCSGIEAGMRERQRLLALLEVYDTAIEELYVLGDRGFVDLILRLERRRREAATRLAMIENVINAWRRSVQDTLTASGVAARPRATSVPTRPTPST